MINESDFFYKVLDSEDDIKTFSAKNFRCVISSNRWDLANILYQNNYIFVDRTIKAIIPLKASKDFQKLCRMEIEISELNERIFEIAKKSFAEDVRFLADIPPKFDEELLYDYLSVKDNSSLPPPHTHTLETILIMFVVFRKKL